VTKKTSPTNTRPRAGQVTAARGKAAALPRKKPRDVADNFQNPAADLASSNSPQNLKFEREDWVLFRTLDGLTQKAGVSRDLLPRLVMKELTDNSVDAIDAHGGGDVEVGKLPTKRGYYVDDKPGIDGTPEEIAHLFSIGRPMISSKLWRLPTRGAVGNGLRVVAGVVLASGGTLKTHRAAS
jgi:hypothetical protein